VSSYEGDFDFSSQRSPLILHAGIQKVEEEKQSISHVIVLAGLRKVTMWLVVAPKNPGLDQANVLPLWPNCAR
jgi:hypothetical protein